MLDFANLKCIVAQSLIAGLAMGVVLFVLQWRGWPLAAALASTNFVLFAMPHSPPARARSAVGGHVIALAAGYFAALLPHSTAMGVVAVSTVAVGLAFFGMQISDTEHPPAAGTALAAVLEGFAWRNVAAIVVGAVLLVLIQWGLKAYLVNLESWGGRPALRFLGETRLRRRFRRTPDGSLDAFA